MRTRRSSSSRGWGRAFSGALGAVCASLWAGRAAAASVTEKTPGFDAPATTPAGSADFLFAHAFSVVGPKVVNSPTFLLDVGILDRLTLGARYASRSTIDGRPNELEALGKIALLAATPERPIALTAIGGYDTAANSAVGELLAGGELGPVGLLAALRGFSAGYGYGGATFAAAIGARARLTRYLYVVADVSHVVGAAHWDRIKGASDRFGWSGGLAFDIPYTPHSLSLYATNLNAHTLLGASRGSAPWMIGFEFDVPFDSAKRWGAIFAPPKQTPKPAVSGAADGGAR